MPYLRNNFSEMLSMTEAPVAPNTASEPGSKTSLTVASLHAAWKANNGEVEGTGEKMDGVPATSSQPPSPPESRSPTPRVTLMPCPVRLLPLVPAPNYGCVVRTMIYRSAFPQARNIEFMETLGIQSILTLVTKTESCEMYDNYVWQYGINRKILDVEPNKEGKVKTNFDTLCDAILFALNPQHHPVYIHCNQGRHRTGCVVACIRKIQQWPMDEILEEYLTYAYPKPREGDIELIKTFDPELVHTYGKQHGLLKGFKTKKMGRERVDSFNSVYELAGSLPPHNTSSLYSSSDSSSSSSSDGPLLMALARSMGKQVEEDETDNMEIDPMLTQTSISGTPDITVSEVDEGEHFLGHGLEVVDGDGEEGMQFEDVRIGSTSATTQPIAIRRRF